MGRFGINKFQRIEKKRYENKDVEGVGYEDHTITWYEGEGLVRDEQTGKEQRFLFYPSGERTEDIVRLSGAQDKIAVTDRPKLYDLAFKSMYELSEESAKVEIIPKIKLPTLNLEDLVRLKIAEQVI